MPEQDSPSFLFGNDYREVVSLIDGTRATLRPVRPQDKPLFVAGMHKLSLESRYRRFFSARVDFTEGELRYLTEIDGVNHFALLALCHSEASEEGIGVARFVRLKGEPEIAEPAVTVIDAAQRNGLGRLLLVRLAAAAAERGIRHFRAEVLPSNAPIRKLIHELVPSAHEATESGVLRIDLPIPPLPLEAHPAVLPVPHPLYRLMQLAADGSLQVRRAALEWLEHLRHGSLTR